MFDLFEIKDGYQFCRRDVSDERFIGVKQLLSLSIRAIVPSRCKTGTLFYDGCKTLVFEMDATSR